MEFDAAPAQANNEESSKQTIWGTSVDVKSIMAEFRKFLEGFVERDSAEDFLFPKVCKEMRQKRDYRFELSLEHLSSAVANCENLYNRLV
jgi:hypothetical protein